MCNAELFVYFAFLASVGVVACIFASCDLLVALLPRHSCLICRCSWYLCAPSYNAAIFPPFCSAPSVGVLSLGGGTRVPFYLVGDVVAY